LFFEIRAKTGFKWLDSPEKKTLPEKRDGLAVSMDALPSNKHELAAILISKALEDGPVESTEIKKLMAQYRIGEKTMHDAKATLGIKPFRKIRRWYWVMPTNSEGSDAE
jgi:hypothetical protein